MEDNIDPKQRERERRIADLLNTPKEVVEESSIKKSYTGSLVICPTPVGNIKDVSLRVLETLDAADIIACEDTRMAGKLFNLLRERKIREEFEDLQNGNDPPASFDDEALFAEQDTREHPNLFQVRREKQRMKEIYQKQEFAKAIEQSKSIIKDLDTFRHFFTKEEDDSNVFDSKDKKPKDKSIYGLDDPYIDYLHEKIKESKLKKGRGLFMSLHKYNEESRVDKLIQAMQAGFIVALISDAGTPTVSDPGSLLVDTCLRRGVKVESLPGPNIVSIALSSSGFPSDRFIFGGYLSKTPSEREDDLKWFHSSGKSLD